MGKRLGCACLPKDLRFLSEPCGFLRCMTICIYIYIFNTYFNQTLLVKQFPQTKTRWWFQIVDLCSPQPGEMIRIWRKCFKWLQPPSRKKCVFHIGILEICDANFFSTFKSSGPWCGGAGFFEKNHQGDDRRILSSNGKYRFDFWGSCYIYMI